MIPKVSVIIPVHNVEAFLPRTIGSVREQTLRDIEIICVDDASTDGSAALLEAMAREEKRLQLIRFPGNRGVSAARNEGLDAARGEYVYFLDSDDWLDPDYLAAMVAEAEESGEDIVVNATYYEEFPETGKRSVSGDFGFLGEKPDRYPVRTVLNRFPPTVWTRLYRRSFLRRSHLRFPGPGIHNGTEDIWFTGLAGMMQESIHVFRGPGYHYLQRPGSLLRFKDIPYYNILTFKDLYSEFGERKIATEGLRLFYAGPVVLDTAEKFDAIRPFFLTIREEVLRHRELYAPVDVFLMEAVCGSGAYAGFCARYNPNISVAFIRSRMPKAHV